MPLPILCPIPFINEHWSGYQNKINSLSMYSDLQWWHSAIPDSKSVIDAVITGICFWYFRLVKMWCLWMWMTSIIIICGMQLRSLLCYCSVSVVVWATSVYGLHCYSGLGARLNWCQNISVLCVGRSFRISPFLRGLWQSSMSLDLALHLKYRRRLFHSHWMYACSMYHSQCACAGNGSRELHHSCYIYQYKRILALRWH